MLKGNEYDDPAARKVKSRTSFRMVSLIIELLSKNNHPKVIRYTKKKVLVEIINDQSNR